MGIRYQVLGGPGQDNALLVRIDSGQFVERLLFDCGEGCLTGLAVSEVQAIDELLFSHLHMDHVGGFDSFFRRNYSRAGRANRIWGPPGTARIMQHRFQGYMWNLHGQMEATWGISDIGEEDLSAIQLRLGEAFSVAHPDGSRPRREPFHSGAAYDVSAIALDHLTPVMAYLVRERPRQNVDVSRLAEMGLAPGPWLAALKAQPDNSAGSVTIQGRRYLWKDLRRDLLVETQGESIAYLTDFLLDDRAMQGLAAFLSGCTTIVCEAQYRQEDAELARRNYHLTAADAATLARSAGVGALVLFHVSDRYREPEWLEMLGEARTIFPNARFAEHWRLAVP